jgi:hypothetical protein
LTRDITTRNILKTAIKNNATDGGKPRDHLKSLFTAVCGKNVELRCLNHKFSRGDAAGKFPIDYQKAGPVHAQH